MRFVPRLLIATVASLLGLTAPALHAAPLPAKVFSDPPAISNVQISRDGKHIVALTSPAGQSPTISVWATDALDKPPAVISAAKVRILGVSFLKNDRLLVRTIQTFTQGNDKGHLTRQYVSDLEGKSWTTLLPDTRAKSELEAYLAKFDDATLIDTLPADPRHVVVEDARINTRGDIVKVDIYSGETERLMRGSDRFFGFDLDLKGEIRTRQELNYDKGAVYIAQWIRDPTNGEWSEHFRWYAKDREPVSIVGFTEDPNIIYISSSRGRDKAGLYVYDIKARQIVEPLLEHKLFDAGGVITSSAVRDYGRVLGFSYAGPTNSIYWTDETLAALNKGLRTALGVKTIAMNWVDPATGAATRLPVTDGADAMITDWSEDLKHFIVEKSGPGNPGEYYLLNASGTLQLLGKVRPDLDTASLGATRLVQYAARDGLMIPAFLTTPPAGQFGPGPYPTLIEPHGGPWARDNLEWDTAGWVQYFASRGYAVLQPQFRGSEGWGQKLWRAGDGEWGQKMQDDKDDGVKWLIDQKIAAPDAVAMFGYSYGGYAALAAAIRPNGLYQCAISGAGAGDLASIKQATFDNRLQREFQNPTIRGLDALEQAKTAQIPLFIYHGDRDTNVDVKQSRKFVDALKAAGKPHRYLEIKDMGHGFVTMEPAMLETQLVEIEKYLNTECGPGGIGPSR
ncbi:alpha/beta hydrolase family protein [Caulobacter sp. ErkDOM-E]|uniref:alpha/beta hydrolase family protein n=1 Tax=Caulobacter sp. ErkDOM-E TaxID=3402778 RepID=UPI003AF7EC72